MTNHSLTNRLLRPFRVLRLGALKNTLTQSLFFLPSLFVAGSLVLSQVTVWIDRELGPGTLPSWFDTTTASSRSILSAVAGGTITAASIVFSLTLVAVQLAASQFSPRVLRGFLGDRFQQVVMGTVVGTFSYALFVLREVQGDGEGARFDYTPQLSIALALVLAVVSLFAILASVDHTAKRLRVGTVADGILDETVRTVENMFVLRGHPPDPASAMGAPQDSPATGVVGDRPPPSAASVLAPRSGWITGVQSDDLVAAIPDGASVLLPAAVGSYVVRGTPVLYIWPLDDDDARVIEDDIESFVRLGDVRTMQQDVGFGIVQLVDIAARALSPGVNDPHTASEIVVRLGAVITELYRRQLPAQQTEIDGRKIFRPREPDYDAFVDAAFEPIRRFARRDPQVLEVIARTIDGIRRDALRRFDDVSALERQLDLMRAELGELATAEDRQRVERTLDELSEAAVHQR